MTDKKKPAFMLRTPEEKESLRKTRLLEVLRRREQEAVARHLEITKLIAALPEHPEVTVRRFKWTAVEAAQARQYIRLLKAARNRLQMAKKALASATAEAFPPEPIGRGTWFVRERLFVGGIRALTAPRLDSIKTAAEIMDRPGVESGRPVSMADLGTEAQWHLTAAHRFVKERSVSQIDESQVNTPRSVLIRTDPGQVAPETVVAGVLDAYGAGVFVEIYLRALPDGEYKNTVRKFFTNAILAALKESPRMTVMGWDNVTKQLRRAVVEGLHMAGRHNGARIQAWLRHLQHKGVDVPRDVILDVKKAYAQKSIGGKRAESAPPPPVAPPPPKAAPPNPPQESEITSWKDRLSSHAKDGT